MYKKCETSKHPAFRRLSLLLLTSILTVLFTGCPAPLNSLMEEITLTKGGEKTDIAVAMILSGHANSVRITPATPEVEALLFQAEEAGAHLLLVSAEGKPRIVYDGDSLHGDVIKNNWSDAKKQKHYRAALEKTLSYFEKAESRSEGLDTLGAIHLAANTLREIPAESRYLIIADTGLSTVAPMDFRSNLLAARPQEVVTALQTQHAVPVLEGFHVIWYGAGAVASPQAELRYQDRDQLKKIYEEILLAGGAASVEFKEYSFTEEIHKELPEIPLVDVAPEGQQEYSPSWKQEGGIQLNETLLYFQDDKAAFVDEEGAKEVLYPIARELCEHPEQKILIVGTTASGREDFCRQLSQGRADLCKKMLIDDGASPSQIIAVGLSFHDPWHTEDLNQKGKLVEAKARKNRKIVILDQLSTEAETILKGSTAGNHRQ